MCPFPPFSILFKYSWLCSGPKWPVSSLSLLSVCVWLVFDNFSLRYSSADIGVAFTCLFVLVIVHLVLCHFYFVASFPVVFCSMPHYSSMHPWSPSSCTALVDPVGGNKIFLRALTSLLTWSWLFISAPWLPSSLSHTMGGLLNLACMPLDNPLKRSVAGLSDLGLISIDLICKKIYRCQQ